MSQSTACIFCKIVAGQSPTAILYQDEQITAFKDIDPKAPVHILIVPNRHFTSLRDVEESDGPLLGHMLLAANRLAAEYGVEHSGYRLVINTGPDVGQSVFHLHMHLVGGRRLPMRFE